MGKSEERRKETERYTALLRVRDDAYLRKLIEYCRKKDEEEIDEGWIEDICLAYFPSLEGRVDITPLMLCASLVLAERTLVKWCDSVEKEKEE